MTTTAPPAIPLARHLLRVRDLIDRAFASPLDVPALARSAHVSEAHFSRSFKAAFGETPHQYLLSRRMERAKALLRADDLSVTDVCVAVGFSSLGSFSTQFRRFVGESPTAYRAPRRPSPARGAAGLLRQALHPTARLTDSAVLEKHPSLPPPSVVAMETVTSTTAP